ncbi:MAG: DUF4412 domain-containing protein [Bacteroidota bacterium]
MNTSKFTFSIPLIACLLFCLLGMTPTSHAQFDRLKRKVDQAMDRAVDKKAEEAADKVLEKTLDKIFQMDGKSSSDSTSNDSSETAEEKLNKLFNTSTNVTIEPVEGEDYSQIEPSSFIGTFEMVTELYKKNKLQKGYPQTNTMSIDAYQFAMQTRDPEKPDEIMTVIFDRRTRKVATKIETDKQAFVAKIPRMKITVEDEEATEAKGEVRATGRSKTIEGYRCDEYIYEDDEVISYVWVAEDFPLNYGELFGFMNFSNDKNGNATSYDDIYPTSGAPLESTTTEKKSGEKSIWRIKNLQSNVIKTELFSLEGYETTDVSRFSDLLNTGDGDQ